MPDRHLVLLPGLLCDHALWAHQAEHLSGIADVMIGDLSRDDSIVAMAERILEEAPDTFALAGLSMGGYVAQEIMRQEPERVERLALIDTQARADSAEQVKTRKDLIRIAGMGKFKGVTPRLLPNLIHHDRPGASVELRDLGFLGLKRYTFPGNSVRVAIQRAGLNSDPVTGRTDSLIYVTGGPMGFTENGQAFTVSEGDFIREIAGLEHFWNVETESEFVTTSGKPLELEAIDPSQATDIPPAK